MQGGAYLTVTWKVLLPRKMPYFVAMYLENDDVTQTVPIKYIMVEDGMNEANLKVAPPLTARPPTSQFRALIRPPHTQAGGDVKFFAINMRKNIVFGLFRGPPEAAELLMKSDVVTLTVPNEPTGGRLTQTTNPTSDAIPRTPHRGHAAVAFHAPALSQEGCIGSWSWKRISPPQISVKGGH